MTAWILSVAGAGLIGVIITHLTEKTRLHKVVRTASTYVFLLVLVFPLPSLVEKGADLGSCNMFDSSVEYDEGVLDVTDGAYFSIVAKSLEGVLRNDGYETVCEIDGSASGEKIAVYSVTVRLIGEFSDSSVTILTVRRTVADYLEIEENTVRVYVDENKR